MNTLQRLASLLLLGLATAQARAEVSIRSDFPGGNVQVLRNEGNTAEVAPDLRSGKAWFYWYFEATASEPGVAQFVFAKPGFIGVRGPAYSTDEGKTWRWLGAEQVISLAPPEPAAKSPPAESFTYLFGIAGERVRFSVGIPYVQSHFEEFLARYRDDARLSRTVLTRSQKGREVELLQLGEPAPGKLTMLLTARHHACEALASYVLEGFLKEALADSPGGARFREKYALLVVPFVDKDGVEEGDQGKNRAPHDHNRDYGEAPLFPEVRAIQELTTKTPVQVSLDLHCPALKGDIHEAFHFLGLGVPHVKANLDEWIQWIAEERPGALMTPLDLLVDPAKPEATNPAINSHHFATQPQIVLAATLENPYTQPKVPLDAEMARAYGAGLVKALTRAQFAPTDGARASWHAELDQLRKDFLQTYRPKPLEAEALAQRYLQEPAKTSELMRIEACNLLALMRLEQRKYVEALSLVEAALHQRDALSSQVVAAQTLRVRILAARQETIPAELEAALGNVLAIPFLSPAQQAAPLAATVEYYAARHDYPTAIAAARRLFTVAAEYEKGRTLNRIAAWHELAGEPEKALAVRQETVALLGPMLTPKPQRSVFGAAMTVDHFEAVMAIPNSTAEEREAAAELVLKHDVVTAAVKEKVRRALTEATQR